MTTQTKARDASNATADAAPKVTAAEILAAIASFSEDDCKVIRNAANERARALETDRFNAHRADRFAYFASLPLGTKIRYTIDTEVGSRIAERLGFRGNSEWELRYVKKGRKHIGVFLSARFDDPPSKWFWVEQSDLMSDRWSAVVAPVES